MRATLIAQRADSRKRVGAKRDAARAQVGALADGALEGVQHGADVGGEGDDFGFVGAGVRRRRRSTGGVVGTAEGIGEVDKGVDEAVEAGTEVEDGVVQGLEGLVVGGRRGVGVEVAEVVEEGVDFAVFFGGGFVFVVVVVVVEVGGGGWGGGGGAGDDGDGWLVGLREGAEGCFDGAEDAGTRP